ncbi:MAG: lysophospholipid acyltransferase family protein, partial [Candidatus Humimicrobiaceae bacterium]
RTMMQFFIFPFISILYRRQYVGKGNLYDIKRPAVVASNHASLIDTFVILFSLPLKIRLRLTTVMSIEHHFLNYFRGTGNILRRIFEAAGFYLFLCLFLNVIPLSRTRGFKQSLENIGSLIDRGWNILIFPEGAITIDGNIKEFESGIGVIAKDMKVPVIPVRIDGLYDILHNGILPLGHLPKIPVVKISFGKQVEMFEGSYHEIADNLRGIVLKL